MKEIIKKIDLSHIILAVLGLVMGICFICIPDTTVKTLCYLIGTVVIISGIVQIVDYFVYGFIPFGFMGGVVSIMLGTLICLFANTLSNPNVFCLLVGVITLIVGLLQVQNSMDYRRLGSKYWWLYTIYAVALVVLSIVMLCNPFAGMRAFTIYLGVVLIIGAIMSIISIIVVKSKIKKIKNTINSIEIE